MRPVIIIFGAAVRPDGQPSGALLERVRAAYRLGERLHDVVYMPTGGVGRHGPAEADVMAALLRDRGVTSDRIRTEPTGTNTLSSVRACAELLRGHTGLVYAATSAYHLPRCVLLLRLAGLRARACPPTWSTASASARKRWYWRLREVPAVPVDAVLLTWLRLRNRM
jgi:uncharacterized SAM-binding protein YcdF (DUF218 family)